MSKKKTDSPGPDKSLTSLDVCNMIRKSIWKVWLRCPEELRPIVVPKFKDFADELARTGDLDF